MSQGARNSRKQGNSNIDRSLARLRRCDVVLVIGVHREELSFGDKVAEGVDSNFEHVGLALCLSSPGIGNLCDRKLALWLIRSVIERWNSKNAALLV